MSRRRARAASAPERTVAQWLGDEYAAGRLTLEEFEIKLDELELHLDSPASVIKYMKSPERPRPDSLRRTLWS